MGNSSSAVRSRQLIEGLTQLGHTVETVHGGGETDARLSCPLHPQHRGPVPCRCPVGRAYRFLLYRALRQHARLCPTAVDRRVYQAVQRSIVSDTLYDLVISSSDPVWTHQMLCEIRRHRGWPGPTWVQHWGDPMATDISRSWLLPRRIVQHLEHRLVSAADRIIYVSPFTLEQQRCLYPDAAEHMHWLPVPFITDLPERPSIQKGAPMQIGYFGDYRQINRNVTPLFDAVVASHDMKLVVAGEGDTVIPDCARIVSPPRLLLEQLKPLMAACQVVVCVLNRTGTQIPGKLYHWAGSTHHILVTYEESQLPVVQHLKCYERFVFCPNKAEAITIALQDIRSGKYDDLAKPCQALSPQVIARKFLEIATG